jgi:hypothetical protein
MGRNYVKINPFLLGFALGFAVAAVLSGRQPLVGIGVLLLITLGVGALIYIPSNWGGHFPDQ